MASPKTLELQRTQGTPTRHWIVGINYGPSGAVLGYSHRPGQLTTSFDGARTYQVQPAGNIVRQRS